MKQIKVMKNLITALLIITSLTIGTAVVYGLIYLFNQMLYYILVHPLDTLLTIIGLIGMYAAYGIINKLLSRT